MRLAIARILAPRASPHTTRKSRALRRLRSSIWVTSCHSAVIRSAGWSLKSPAAIMSRIVPGVAVTLVVRPQMPALLTSFAPPLANMLATLIAFHLPT